MLKRLLVATLACALIVVALPVASPASDAADGSAFMLSNFSLELPTPGMWQTGWLDWLRFGAAVVVAFITAWCSRDPAPGGC